MARSAAVPKGTRKGGREGSRSIRLTLRPGTLAPRRSNRWFRDRADHDTVVALERWRGTMREAVDDIERWRDVGADDLAARAWPNRVLWMSLTKDVLTALARECPTQDRTPVERVLACVSRWDERKSAAALPPQDDILDDVRLAVLRVEALLDVIIGRSVPTDPMRAGKPPRRRGAPERWDSDAARVERYLWTHRARPKRVSPEELAGALALPLRDVYGKAKDRQHASGARDAGHSWCVNRDGVVHYEFRCATTEKGRVCARCATIEAWEKKHPVA